MPLDRDNYIDEDSKKSLAIVNLQAIINIEDVDQVIKLLQENNWDESVLFLVNFIRQLLQHIMLNRCMKVREPKAEEEKKENQEDQRGYLRASWDVCKSIGWVVWSGLVGFIRIIFPLNQVNQEVNGRQFNETFTRIVSQNLSELKIEIKFSERDFYDLCALSRRAKKPILLVVLRDDTLGSVEDIAQELANEHIQEMIGQAYNVFGIFRNRLRDRTLGDNLVLPNNVNAALFVVTVRPQNNIALESRLTELNEQSILNFLTENLSLFHFMCEEDPEYSAHDLLTNAGLLPPGMSTLQGDDHDLMEMERQERERVLKESQRMELEEAKRLDQERLEQQRLEQEKKQQEEEQRKQQEAEKQKKIQEKLDQAKRKSEKLPEEPDANHSEACHIVFRMPLSGERVNRRFLKSEKIQVLYDFVESLGDKVQLEDESKDFEIIQSMPRKSYNNKEQSLQEAGLFPRAMLQIKEVD